MRLSKLAWALVVATVAAACEGDNETHMGTMGAMGDVMAPEQLVMNGQYSDERFIGMMAAHHQMALAMAEVERQHGARPELQALAGRMIEAQRREIDELQAIKEAHFGSSGMPTMMHPSHMDNAGMIMPSELATEPDVDKAFIDSMLPHHAGAIEMASAALRRSKLPEIQALCRRIIDAQSEEIGQMIEWRKDWYGGHP